MAPRTSQAHSGVRRMKPTRVATIEVKWSDGTRVDKPIRLNLAQEALPRPVSPLGARGLSAAMLDLVDLAAVVFHAERSLTGRMRTNLPVDFTIAMPVRDLRVWNRSACNNLEVLL